MDHKLISLPQAAKICGISRWTLRSYIKSGNLKVSRTPGGHYRISIKELEAFTLKMGMRPHTDRVQVKTILVVDDDPKIRKLLSRSIRSKYFHVKTASDGFEAGQMSIKIKPDLVILDIFMPQIDGFEVCRRLIRDPATPSIKIIAISGADTPENREKILSSGAHLFLPKPLEIKKLKKRIGSLLPDSEYGKYSL